MDSYYDELTKLLPHDHTLIRLCASSLSAADVTLTQHLLQLQETIATLTESMPALEVEVGCVDCAISDCLDGGSGERVRCAVVNREACDRGVEMGEEVWEEYGDNEMTDVVVHLSAGEGGESLGIDVVVPVAGVIQASSDFPSGPVISGSRFSEEPDLGHTLNLEEDVCPVTTVGGTVECWNTSNVLVMEENITGSAVVVKHSEDMPAGSRFARGSDRVDVVRSQSETIPPAMVSNMSNPLLMNSSTPNPSVGHFPVVDLFSFGGSEQPVSLDPPVSSVESQGDLECQVKEAIASRCLQISLQMATSKEEDVIAIPVVTRGSSTG